MNAAASPPVAITSGSCGPGHSALMRRTSPSMASAAPSTTPDRMHSSVRRPMTRAGGSNSVAVSLAVFRNSVSADICTPGEMTPPMNLPSPVMQSKVVAVPRSTTMQSQRCSRLAASVLMMRSAPTVSGSSTSSVMGSLDLASTITAGVPTRRAQASANGPVTAGTTDPIAVPVTALTPIPDASSSDRTSR